MTDKRIPTVLTVGGRHTLKDSQGKIYANAEEWMKEVGQSELAQRNTDAVRAHATECKIFQMAGATRARDRDLAKRASSQTPKSGGARKSA